VDLIAAYAPTDRSVPTLRVNMISSLDGAAWQSRDPMTGVRDGRAGDCRTARGHVVRGIPRRDARPYVHGRGSHQDGRRARRRHRAFSHIVAGSAECFYVIFAGQRPLTDYIVGYFVPVLLGNTLGGVVFVAALAHAQHGPSIVTGARGARRVRQS